MTPIHLGAGLVIAGAVVAFIAALQFNTPPNAQRLAVVNEYADAKCSMEFYDGVRVLILRAILAKREARIVDSKDEDVSRPSASPTRQRPPLAHPTPHTVVGLRAKLPMISNNPQTFFSAR